MKKGGCSGWRAAARRKRTAPSTCHVCAMRLAVKKKVSQCGRGAGKGRGGSAAHLVGMLCSCGDGHLRAKWARGWGGASGQTRGGHSAKACPRRAEGLEAMRAGSAILVEQASTRIPLGLHCQPAFLTRQPPHRHPRAAPQHEGAAHEVGGTCSAPRTAAMPKPLLRPAALLRCSVPIGLHHEPISGRCRHMKGAHLLPEAKARLQEKHPS